MRPFINHISSKSSLFETYDNKVVRRLSDMKGFYADSEAEKRMIADGDPVLYEMLEVTPPEEPGNLTYCTTVLYPGKVGEEYFMTKGHIHVIRGTAEVYYFTHGEGVLVCETPEGEVSEQRVVAGDVAYVPAGWAHRTINIGNDNLVFFAIYPAGAGHDYDFIAVRGFKIRIMDDGNGGYRSESV